MIWVQTGVSQVGFYPQSRSLTLSTKGPGWGKNFWLQNKNNVVFKYVNLADNALDLGSTYKGESPLADSEI